jgi:hypothetical protein
MEPNASHRTTSGGDLCAEGLQQADEIFPSDIFAIRLLEDAI